FLSRCVSYPHMRPAPAMKHKMKPTMATPVFIPAPPSRLDDGAPRSGAFFGSLDMMIFLVREKQLEAHTSRARKRTRALFQSSARSRSSRALRARRAVESRTDTRPRLIVRRGRGEQITLCGPRDDRSRHRHGGLGRARQDGERALV